MLHFLNRTTQNVHISYIAATESFVILSEMNHSNEMPVLAASVTLRVIFDGNSLKEMCRFLKLEANWIFVFASFYYV